MENGKSVHSTPKTKPPPRMSSAERKKLEALLKSANPNGALSVSLSWLHGFCTSVICGPLIMPSEWLPIVLGDFKKSGWESVEQVQSATDSVLRFYNEVAFDLMRNAENFSILVDDSERAADGWCNGFVLGQLLRAPEWKRALKDMTVYEALAPIMAILTSAHDHAKKLSDRAYAAATAQLPINVLSIYKWWREHPVVHAGVRKTAQRKAGKKSPRRK
jgi:yecA family protein